MGNLQQIVRCRPQRIQKPISSFESYMWSVLFSDSYKVNIYLDPEPALKFY